MNELEPSEFCLAQNYPNPFKEKTIIKYCVAYKTLVNLKVFNNRGKEIEKLVDEEKKPGTYAAIFNNVETHRDASIQSGTYCYRFVAGDYKNEKKML